MRTVRTVAIYLIISVIFGFADGWWFKKHDCPKSTLEMTLWGLGWPIVLPVYIGNPKILYKMCYRDYKL